MRRCAVTANRSIAATLKRTITQSLYGAHGEEVKERDEVEWRALEAGVR